jgi:DNA polymerase-1
MATRERTLYLVDGSAQVHRAYFAIRGLSTSRGLPTGAVYGFTTMLRKLLADEEPDWIGLCFDPPGRTARHQEYKDYKANRRKMDDALAVQVPYVRRVCQAFQLPVVEIAGVEADDVIATLSRQAVEHGFGVVVVSADKDLLQLVGDRVLVLNPGREGSGAVLYDRRTVEERFGVPPEQVVDVLALMGDAVDNVPGVPGIGDKGARELVREYGSLEAVLESAGNLKRAAYREGLLRHEEAALLSKRLVTLRADVPVTLDLEALARRPPDRAAVYALCKELEFQILARDFAPEPAALPTASTLMGTAEDLAAFAAAARAAGRMGMSLALSAREPMRARLLGIGLSAAEGRGVYLPLGHSTLEVPQPAAPQALREHLLPLLLDPAVEKVTARGKQDVIVLGRHALGLEGPRFDVMVAGYLLNPGRRSLSVEELASEHLGLRLRPLSGVLTGEAGEATLATASAAATQEADLMLRLAGPLRLRLEEEELGPVFTSMEMPLSAVLADMERAGVRVNREFLGELSREMEEQIGGLTRRIHELAGGEFNVNSPPQLREVLFDRLALRTGRRTAKTRAASTAEEVLEELARGHELPRKVLEYRGVQKLKSTYVDALPGLVNPETGRIHASFNQTVAATGRLSVADPNLQNIPIRTAEGRRIREAFVPEAGHLLLSADYSQIELRILAHLCKDPILIDTFRRGEDVHDRTAREVFGPLSALPADEQRRQAKMINYALLYGKTAFSLARDIGASKRDAEEFIRAYFARYPEVRRFIDETLTAARETGVVRTLLGRLRRLPELRSPNFQVRMEAERQAVNTPVQGSAADLIKKAMIDLHAELGRRGLRSRLILQIHDELLLEVPEAEVEEVPSLVREVMEGALHLDVPLVVEARLGASWAEVH